jgi:hypothetical protein
LVGSLARQQHGERKVREVEKMKVTMLLADAAQVAGGKLQIIGGGWSVTGPQPVASALAVLIQVPWMEANTKHVWELTLYDGDGHPVAFPDPEGQAQEIRLASEFEVGRPPGVTPGTLLEAPFAVSLGPLPLAPGSRYVWRLTIDGRGDENWQVAFSTRPEGMRLAG